jgi:type II secretory ATPase GspE/PulE/Tfp pilus assembly ATPase PilB-like protein
MSDSEQDTAKTGQSRQVALQEELRELIDVVGPAPLVDLLLERSFQIGATDIHFDPTATGLRVRLRVDGLMHDVVQLPPAMMAQVISRLKLMGEMDITEKRLAQDGHISNTVLAQQRDIRVGSGPTIHGERLVLRLMPDAGILTQLEELGFDNEQEAAIRRALSAPYGTILSVGPVGSGKSTTMYACTELLNEPTKSVITIEDPVERRIEGINQLQIDPKIGLNFVSALRGTLRQDPNVLMIGEIRDPETARIGVRAGLTGVLVLSTLHANDAPSTIDVFRQFDVPAMFIADSLQAIISQRLIRKVCQHCKVAHHPDHAMCEALWIDPNEAEQVELFRGTGCNACFHTGYHGRTGVFEILSVDHDFREAILRGASHGELLDLAKSKGMKTLEMSAREKVKAGITTVEEMHRVMTAYPT